MSRIPLVLLSAALIALSALGCGSTDSATARDAESDAAFDLSAMRNDIEARNRVFTNAHVIGDSVAMVDIFADDARVLPPNADPVIGRAAIEVLTAAYLTYGITEFREETIEFYGNQDLLIDEGRYVMVYGNDNTREEGKYVNIWRKQRGEWKLYSNIWNSSAPLPSDR